jgi:hypothetical protein
MGMVRRAAIATAFFVSTLSACSGAPPLPPPPLSDAKFQQIFDAARAPDDAFREDRNLTVLLARTDLSLEQRLKTLDFRAIGRSTTGENKNGAIADYEELLALAPSNHPMVARVREDLDYVRQQKRYIEDRLEGRARSDNSQHFEDLLALGRHDEAVAFMKYTGLKPHAVYIEKLAKLGYLCEGPTHSGASFQWGASNTGMHTVYWCDSPPPPREP